MPFVPHKKIWKNDKYSSCISYFTQNVLKGQHYSSILFNIQLLTKRSVILLIV